MRKPSLISDKKLRTFLDIIVLGICVVNRKGMDSQMSVSYFFLIKLTSKKPFQK